MGQHQCLCFLEEETLITFIAPVNLAVLIRECGTQGQYQCLCFLEQETLLTLLQPIYPVVANRYLAVLVLAGEGKSWMLDQHENLLH